MVLGWHKETRTGAWALLVPEQVSFLTSSPSVTWVIELEYSFSSTKLILSGPCCRSLSTSLRPEGEPDTFPGSHGNGPSLSPALLSSVESQVPYSGHFLSTHSPPLPPFSSLRAQLRCSHPGALPPILAGPGASAMLRSAPPPPDIAPSTQQAPCMGSGSMCRCACKSHHGLSSAAFILVVRFFMRKECVGLAHQLQLGSNLLAVLSNRFSWKK